MNDQISHDGVVESISKAMLHVRIVQSSACSACKVSTYCASSERKEKIINVPCLTADSYTIGQPVTVVGSTSIGLKAVLLAFAIPSVLLLATIVAGIRLGMSELMACLAAVGVLVIYYIIMYACKAQLTEMLSFRVASEA